MSLISYSVRQDFTHVIKWFLWARSLCRLACRATSRSIATLQSVRCAKPRAAHATQRSPRGSPTSRSHRAFGFCRFKGNWSTDPDQLRLRKQICAAGPIPLTNCISTWFIICQPSCVNGVLLDVLMCNCVTPIVGLLALNYVTAIMQTWTWQNVQIMLLLFIALDILLYLFFFAMHVCFPLLSVVYFCDCVIICLFAKLNEHNVVYMFTTFKWPQTGEQKYPDAFVLNRVVWL